MHEHAFLESCQLARRSHGHSAETHAPDRHCAAIANHAIKALCMSSPREALQASVPVFCQAAQTAVVPICALCSTKTAPLGSNHGYYPHTRLIILLTAVLCNLGRAGGDHYVMHKRLYAGEETYRVATHDAQTQIFSTHSCASSVTCSLALCCGFAPPQPSIPQTEACA